MIYLGRPELPSKLQELQAMTLKLIDLKTMQEEENYFEFIGQLAAVVIERGNIHMSPHFS